jgi:uncharacterized Zn finger protein
MSYYGWKPYVSVAERRKKAEKAAAKAAKSGAQLTPIAPYRGAIAKTFWGKAWCDNLERYSDYENRLPRGRTYLRNGSVIDLRVAAGEVRAQVMGSSLYQVAVTVAAVPGKQWRAVGADCASSINSLVELLQGKLSKAVMERICTPSTGLFPAAKEIRFACSCPDSASMCKHVAAVLYGIGARLDAQPELLFTLRRVDAKDLVAQAGAGLPKTGKAPVKSKVLDDALLADVFGIELDEVAPLAKAAPVTPRRKVTADKAVVKVAAKKVTAKPAVANIAKPVAPKKAAGVKKVAPPKPVTTARKPAAVRAPAGSAAAKTKKTINRIRAKVG